jgi:hypothetical protein
MGATMQALYLIYDESLHAEITAIVERDMVVPRYTRIDHVIGARMAEALRALRDLVMTASRVI